MKERQCPPMTLGLTKIDCAVAHREKPTKATECVRNPAVDHGGLLRDLGHLCYPPVMSSSLMAVKSKFGSPGGVVALMCSVTELVLTLGIAMVCIPRSRLDRTC